MAAVSVVIILIALSFISVRLCSMTSDNHQIELTVMLDMFCVVLAVVSAQALLGFTLGVPIPHFCISFEGLMIPKKEEKEGEKSKMAITGWPT